MFFLQAFLFFAVSLHIHLFQVQKKHSRIVKYKRFIHLDITDKPFSAFFELFKMNKAGFSQKLSPINEQKKHGHSED